MSEWIDVPVADVAVGDEVKVNGYGRLNELAYTFNGHDFHPVISVESDDIVVGWMHGEHVFILRSSIVAVRRRKPEPSPKPGDWRCRVPGTCPECLAACGCQAWASRMVRHCSSPARSTAPPVAGAEIRGTASRGSDHYKRIGLDVRPVDRRGKR